MAEAGRLHGIGLWLAGLAIGTKVILAAFAAAPWDPPTGSDGDGVATQVICTGSGFLIVVEDADGEKRTLNLSVCPFYTLTASVVLAAEPELPLTLFFFTILLAALAGLDRPRRDRPQVAGFLSRAPPYRSPPATTTPPTPLTRACVHGLRCYRAAAHPETEQCG